LPQLNTSEPLALRYSPLRRQAIDTAIFPSIPSLLASEYRCPRPLYTVCVYPISSCLKLSKAHSTDQQLRMHLLHYPALFNKQSTESTHSWNQRNLPDDLFNPPNVLPAFPIFLYDLPHFRSQERLLDRHRRPQCFQARRGSM